MSGLNRKQRRASAKRKQTKGSGFTENLPPSRFRDQIEELAGLGGFANHVSMAYTGLPTSTHGAYASMVFAKCCAHARSIGAIATQSSMFDHHTIMALSRMIMEAATMIAYLLDPVSDEESAFRHTVLRLHDTTGRIKLIRGFGQPADDLKAGRQELQTELAAMPLFAAVPEDRKNRLMNGEEMYVVGMRSVAIKMMGWDEKQFNGIYSYLSAHTHSAPMSFMRMERHRIDYLYPSETQFEILALSMEVAIACLRRVMIRMIDQHPDKIDEFHAVLLATARESDATCPLFKKQVVSP